MAASTALAADRTVETGYAALNVIDYRTYTRWKDDAVGTTYLSIAFGATKTANAFAIAGHNLSQVTTPVLTLEYKDTTWKTAGTKNTFADNNPFMVTFTQQTSTEWRLKIESGGSVTPEIGVLFVGDTMDFSYPPDAPFTPISKSIDGEMVESKTGNLLGGIVRHKPASIQVSFTNHTRTFVDTYYSPFWLNHASELLPFFWAWDNATYPAEVYYVRIDQASTYDVPISIASIADRISLNMRTVL